MSSRTDAGVHAISNTGHFDLEFNEELLKGASFQSGHQGIDEICSLLKNNLNELLISTNHFIR